MTRLLPVLTEAEKVERLRAMGLDADRDPLTLTAAEKSAAALPGLPAPSQEPHMSDVPVPPSEVSPTGKPLVSPKVVPFLALLVAAAAAVAAGAPDILPDTTIDQTIAGIIVALGTVFGIVSPGMRRKV